jgi:hypothetical protein
MAFRMSQFSQGRLSKWPSRKSARAAEKDGGLFGRVKLCVFGCNVPISPAAGMAELVQCKEKRGDPVH